MDIVHNLKIKASANTVYDAVASENGITGWWSKDCKVGEETGANSVLNFDKNGTIVTMHFRTVELSPERKVVWECTENPNPSWIGTKVVTEIQSINEECHVFFSHTGFDDKWKGQDPFEMTKDGWKHFVESLVNYCETGKGQPW